MSVTDGLDCTPGDTEHLQVKRSLTIPPRQQAENLTAGFRVHNWLCIWSPWTDCNSLMQELEIPWLIRRKLPLDYTGNEKHTWAFSLSCHESAFQWRGAQCQAFNDAANSIPNLNRCQVRAHLAPRRGKREAVKAVNSTHDVHLRNPSRSRWELGRLPWKSSGKLKKHWPETSQSSAALSLPGKHRHRCCSYCHTEINGDFDTSIRRRWDGTFVPSLQSNLLTNGINVRSSSATSADARIKLRLQAPIDPH